MVRFLSILLISLLLIGCNNTAGVSQSIEVQKTIEDTHKGDIILEPTQAKWTLDTNMGADMPSIYYATDDIIIFHGSFGLFVYDLNKETITNSLDVISIGCSYTQGDAFCTVTVSDDGKVVQLHPENSNRMYTYNIYENTLVESDYVPLKNLFKGKFVESINVVDNKINSLSYSAVAFDSGEYGYLLAKDFNLRTLEYVRGEKHYTLFK